MSGKRLQLKRGTTAQTSTFTGLNGEVIVDTTKKTLVVHDGATVGGTVLAKDSDVALKVDKVIGKQLSTEDYTTAEKNKLAGIQEGAEVNVNADWNAISGDAEILNKPTKFPPSLHTHTIADVNNLETTLQLKQKKLSVITIVGNTTLSEIHNGAILHITNTCNITIPTGLGADFSCDCYVKGAFIATFVNGGVTLNSPSGLLLKTDKMATIYSNASDVFNLLGELATS